MFLCEAKKDCTILYGAKNLTKLVKMGTRKKFDKCPKHWKVVAELSKGKKPDLEEPEDEPVIMDDGLPDFKTKKEMEDYARGFDPPIELDRRKNMDDLRAELLEHITKPAE